MHLARDLGTSKLPYSVLTRFIQFLPEESAVARARRDHAPSVDIQFLRRIENHTAKLFWAETKDAEKGSNPPQPVPLHGDKKNGSRRDPLELNQLLAQRQAKRARDLQRAREGK